MQIRYSEELRTTERSRLSAHLTGQLLSAETEEKFAFMLLIIITFSEKHRITEYTDHLTEEVHLYRLLLD